MNVLFIHQNFPGQFGNLAAALAREPGNTVRALAMERHPAPPGVQVNTYTLLRAPAPETHPLLRDEESKVLRAEACASAALKLKLDGFVPDLIVAHPGWGEALFIKDVFPQARLVIYCEYYYALEGQDVGFDPEFAPFNFAQRCMLRLKNTTNLLSLEIADAALSPTEWQKSTYPAWAQDKITVIHDGIDLQRVRYAPQARFAIAGAGERPPLALRAGDEVLTYVARNLEPVRGFHMFMRSLPELLRRRPQAQVVIAGGNEVGYGSRPAGVGGWKEQLLGELGSGLDLSRLHFVGKLSYDRYLDLLSVSRVHSYWTTPFVLSWSFLEAAANGLPLIASDTPPVREFDDLPDLRAVDFFDTRGFAEAIGARLADPAPRRPQQQLPARIDLRHCLAAQKNWLGAL